LTGPILIWGAGAIGGTLGAAFIRAGEEVVFVDAAADHVAAIRRDGLRIDGPIWQDRVTAPAFTPAEIEGTFDRAYLCVKAHQTRAAAQALRPHLSPAGYVVSAQNGLNEKVIAEIVGPERTVGCFVNFGADYLGPGVVHFSGRGAVVIGELDGARTERVEAIWKLLRQFSEDAILTPNIWGYLWGKMVYGALLFGTAVTNASIADALEAPKWRATLTALGQEVARVGVAEGVALEGFDGFDPNAFAPGAPPEVTADSFDRMVRHNRKSAKSHSGIWRDLAIRKRPTEVDAQLGPSVRIGAAHGLASPLTSAVISMIHEIENGTRELSDRNLDELANMLS
jgi:2-dehydropantoate 2-reductase